MTSMRRPSPIAGQRGAAALIVVMLLFFVISMVAAYASRNLIFEQKTSANQYRATQAFEAAEAGLEWAVALLNGGRVDAACVASADVANDTFRARYLDVDAGGNFVPRTWDDAGTTEALRPSCVRTDAGWSCSCPAAADPVLAAPAGAGSYPAFRLRFEATGQPGAVRVLATGCTRMDESCLSAGQGTAGEAAATVSIVVALSQALATPPSAALTVRGNLDTASALRLQNTDVATAGITAHVGGTVTAPAAVLRTVPGSPAEASIAAGDASLASRTGAQLFASLFRVDKTVFSHQPGVVRLAGCAAACTAKLQEAVLSHPGRVLWVDGDLTIESDLVLGSANEPVLLVATGNVTLSAPSVQIFGLLYSQAADWDNDGLGATVLRGAAVAEGNFIGSGLPVIEYDPAILRRLQLATGALVRVPGSWRDF